MLFCMNSNYLFPTSNARVFLFFSPFYCAKYGKIFHFTIFQHLFQNKIKPIKKKKKTLKYFLTNFGTIISDKMKKIAHLFLANVATNYNRVGLKYLNFVMGIGGVRFTYSRQGPVIVTDGVLDQGLPTGDREVHVVPTTPRPGTGRYTQSRTPTHVR